MPPLRKSITCLPSPRASTETAHSLKAERPLAVMAVVCMGTQEKKPPHRAAWTQKRPHLAGSSFFSATGAGATGAAGAAGFGAAAPGAAGAAAGLGLGGF